MKRCRITGRSLSFKMLALLCVLWCPLSGYTESTLSYGEDVKAGLLFRIVVPVSMGVTALGQQVSAVSNGKAGAVVTIVYADGVTASSGSTQTTTVRQRVGSETAVHTSGEARITVTYP